MAILNDEQWSLIKGIGIGVGVALVGRKLVPPLRDAGRPLAKAGLKGGLELYEQGREAVARAGETLEDLLVEIEVERKTEALGAAAAARRAADPEQSGPRAVPDPQSAGEGDGSEAEP